MDANVPYSVGVIMDGNRRWAKENNLPQLEGHRRGLDKVKELGEWIDEKGIKEVVLYAFSTENWNRSPEEVDYLMAIFGEAFERLPDELGGKDVRIRFIGQRERMPEKLQRQMQEAEEKTKDAKKGTLVIALSYGGRAEILAAVNKLLAAGWTTVDEAQFREAMWSAGLAYPDLIIRTGGDRRLSNFLTWQSAYSELYFTETKWPAFSKREFEEILADFGSRERRYGR